MNSRRRRSDRRDVRPREFVDFSTEIAQLSRHGAQKHKRRIRSDGLALVADLLDVLRNRRCHRPCIDKLRIPDTAEAQRR